INAEREEIVQFMRAAVSLRPTMLLAEIERLNVRADRRAVERSLRMLQVWIREALVLRERGTGGNGQGADDIRRFTERFPDANLAAALESVEASIALLNKNVYLPLILTNLALDLKNHSTSPSAQ
ncbi:MAG: hypothetical protein ACRDGA_06090, partial [Bacteroidota bacterium]